MMTSSNGNIFRVTGSLCGEFTAPGEFPTQRPVTRSFDVFFDLRLNKRLSKQLSGWWFETPSWSLWRQCNGCPHPLRLIMLDGFSQWVTTLYYSTVFHWLSAYPDWTRGLQMLGPVEWRRQNNWMEYCAIQSYFVINMITNFIIVKSMCTVICDFSCTWRWGGFLLSRSKDSD